MFATKLIAKKSIQEEHLSQVKGFRVFSIKHWCLLETTIEVSWRSFLTALQMRRPVVTFPSIVRMAV